MTRAALDWLFDRNHPRRRWIAGGAVLLGLGAMNQPSRSPMGARPAGFAPVPARGFGAGPVDQTAGWMNNGGETPMSGNAAPYQPAENEPTTATGYAAPAAGGFAPANDSSALLPSNGDSVPESVNTNFSDYMRDQQRVVSENDGQTYITGANADPNQMTDTRDSVSGFSAAAPGSEAAGYAEVAPSGATTVDTSTATPVDTSSASSTTTGE